MARKAQEKGLRVLLEPEVHAAFKASCARYGYSMTEVLRAFIDYKIQQDWDERRLEMAGYQEPDGHTD